MAQPGISSETIAFVARVERRENPGDCDGAKALVADAPRCIPNGAPIQGHEEPPVIIVPALDHLDAPGDDTREVLGPIAEGRQARACRHSDADCADPAQPPPLHHCVDEMRRADHDGIDRCRADRAGRGQAS
jgi:hypothetical protein